MQTDQHDGMTHEERKRKVLAQGDYKTVSGDPRVVEAYIGSGHA